MIEIRLASLGTNSLGVNSGQKTKNGKTVVTGNVKPLTGKDVDAIGKIKAVKYASAVLNTTGNVVPGNRNVLTAVTGVGEDSIFINNWFPERMTFFNHLCSQSLLISHQS